LTFKYSSTCFESPHAHNQELNNCSSNLWFYRWSVVVAVLLVVVGPAGLVVVDPLCMCPTLVVVDPLPTLASSFLTVTVSMSSMSRRSVPSCSSTIFLDDFLKLFSCILPNLPISSRILHITIIIIIIIIIIITIIIGKMC